MRFDARIGGILVAPRRTLARLVDGESRARDVVWLLAARLVAGQLPELVRAVLLGCELGVAAGVQAALATVRELLPDILGILIAGVTMSFFVGKEARGYGRTFDLAAYAWIPYLALELAGALYFTARGYAPSPRTQLFVDGAAVAWAVVVWTLALIAARAPREAAS